MLSIKIIKITTKMKILMKRNKEIIRKMLKKRMKVGALLKIKI
jgi:hypothetical protein